MRALTLSELREVLQGPHFTAWWREYGAALEAERQARTVHDQSLAGHRLADLQAESAQRQAIDAFSAAGEAEEEAARVAAESQAHEVRALDEVGKFEEQRFRTSDLWYRLGGAERTVEVRREAMAEVGRTAAEAGRATPEADRSRGQAEAALRQAERQLRALQGEYAQEDAKRTRLWDEVERAWARSFERSLIAAEHATRARSNIRDAEGLFREAEERRVAARGLREQAEAAARALAEAARRRAGLVEAARERFGCVTGEAFLYWRHPEDQRAAWAVALRGDPSGWNLPVRPLEVFTVGRMRGAAYLQPAREGLPLSLEQGDRRFEDYFLGPRLGARPVAAAAVAPEVDET